MRVTTLYTNHMIIYYIKTFIIYIFQLNVIRYYSYYIIIIISISVFVETEK